MDGYLCDGREPFFAAVACLHLETIFTGGEAAIACGMCAGTCPLGVVTGEPVAELDVRGIREKACVEEEDKVLLSGLKIDVRSGDRVGRAGIICPTGDCGGWAKRVRLISDISCVNETLGG